MASEYVAANEEKDDLYEEISKELALASEEEDLIEASDEEDLIETGHQDDEEKEETNDQGRLQAEAARALDCLKMQAATVIQSVDSFDKHFMRVFDAIAQDAPLFSVNFLVASELLDDFMVDVARTLSSMLGNRNRATLFFEFGFIPLAVLEITGTDPDNHVVHNLVKCMKSKFCGLRE